MTVEEFSRLPIDDGPVYHELRHGEMVAIPRPAMRYMMIQRRVRDLLSEFAPPDSMVERVFAYQPAPEFELRVADVGYVRADRIRTIDPEGYLSGPPDLVVQVVSPATMAMELNEREQLCLENGAKEFWVVHPEQRRVTVSWPNGIGRTFRAGQEIPLPLFGDHKLPVDAIFG